jgi:2-oxoglutarate ferredoxin oxidoreductase subunit beta
LATGIKLGRPELTVVAVGGDGDGFSIGGGHLPHAARRNVDLTYIVMDNSIYGMTKGQPSPTTPPGTVRKASPYGSLERPLNPLMMLLAYEASFVARAFSGEIKQMVEIIKSALQHPGFAFVQVLSPCVSFYDSYDHYRGIAEPLPEEHDRSDLMEAMRLARVGEPQYLGIFYEERERQPYSAQIEGLQKRAPETTVSKVMDRYLR